MSKASVFISYNRADEEWKDRLLAHLGVLEREDLLEVWDDQKIAPGSAWRADIEAAMERATVALLLISVEFLNSRFIRSEEVPQLLERRRVEGLTVIPLLVRPCAWEVVPWLARMQLWPRHGRALAESNVVDVDNDLAALALEIWNQLRGTDEKQHGSRMIFEEMRRSLGKSTRTERLVRTQFSKGL